MVFSFYSIRIYVYTSAPYFNRTPPIKIRVIKLAILVNFVTNNNKKTIYEHSVKKKEHI
jgi:hypothetical protein